MSDVAAGLAKIPGQRVVELASEQLNALLSSSGQARELHWTALQRFLDTDPGLTRTDAGWYEQHPDKPPLICEAAEDSRTYDFFLECMKRGSSPVAKGPDGMPALLKLLDNAENKKENFFPTLRQALDHADCRVLDATNAESYIALQYTQKMMRGTGSDALDQTARDLFKLMVERTPPALLQKKMGVQYFFDGPSCTTTEENMVFMARLLTDHGVNPDNSITDNNIDYHPLHILTNSSIDMAAAVLACGMDETHKCRTWEGETVTTGEYLDGKLGFFTEGNGVKLRQRAREMLQAELNRITAGGKAPRDVLLTPAGHASWQAQGLAVQGMLAPLFTPENAGLFGGEAGRIAFACELAEAMPPHRREHFNLQAVLRDAPLARPSDSAVVKYVRGGAVNAATGLAG